MLTARQERQLRLLVTLQQDAGAPWYDEQSDPATWKAWAHANRARTRQIMEQVRTLK